LKFAWDSWRKFRSRYERSAVDCVPWVSGGRLVHAGPSDKIGSDPSGQANLAKIEIKLDPDRPDEHGSNTQMV